MKWKIVADSGCDIKNYHSTDASVGFESVPLTIEVSGETFVDDDQIDVARMLEMLKDSKEGSSSAAPAPGRYVQAFEGAKNVLCVTLSSQLSGSFNSATMGAQIAREENPEANIHVFDSRSAGSEMNLLVEHALKQAKKGITFEAMIDEMDAYHETTNINYMLSSVDNLKNNGRITRFQATMIGLLGMRLIGKRTKDGLIDLAETVRGERRGIRTLLDQLANNGYASGNIELSHALNADLAERIAATLRDRFNPENITIREMSGLCAYYAENGGVIVGYEHT